MATRPVDPNLKTYFNPPPRYVLGNPAELWWCNSHQRRATHVRKDEALSIGVHCCEPGLPGNLLTCRCVNLTGKLELMEG